LLCARAFTLAAITLSPTLHAAGPGSRDASFAAVQPNNSVYAMALQPDGKVLFGGVVTEVNGQPRWLVARANTDGTLDPTFVPGITVSDLAIVLALAVQRNGQILAGGDGGLFRLNPDGSVDHSFTATVDQGITALETQSDGRILVAGTFNTIGGVAKHRLARLDAAGAVDATFTADARLAEGGPPTVWAIRQSAGGHIYVAGEVGPPDQLGDRVCVARLEPDGALDTRFQGPHASGVVTLALQRNGRVLFGGYFTYVNGEVRPALARTGAHGGVDLTFDAQVGDPAGDPSVAELFVQPDQKILVLGHNLTAIGGQTGQRMPRLLSNGSFDPSFDTGTNAWFDGDVFAVQPDGKIIVWAGSLDPAVYPTGIVRLNNNPFPAILSFASARFAVGENVGGASATVVRTGNTNSAVSLSVLALGGSATPHRDYEPVLRHLRFSPGETTRSFSVPIINDRKVESEERIWLTLFHPSAGAQVGPPAFAYIAILDDDRR
jgi:uncharacterized delta-60 repeat protein